MNHCDQDDRYTGIESAKTELRPGYGFRNKGREKLYLRINDIAIFQYKNYLR